MCVYVVIHKRLLNPLCVCISFLSLTILCNHQHRELGASSVTGLPHLNSLSIEILLFELLVQAERRLKVLKGGQYAYRELVACTGDPLVLGQVGEQFPHH